MNNQEKLDFILYQCLPSERTAFLLDNAAWAWTAQASVIGERIGQIVISGGMGLENTAMIWNSRADMNRYSTYFKEATHAPPQRWNRINVDFLVGAEDFFTPMDVFAALDAGRDMLDQTLFDFLMARDKKMITGAFIHYTETEHNIRHQNPIPASALREYFSYSPEEYSLADAFHNQMIQEAAPMRHRILTGAFVMTRTPFAIIDQTIIYDSLRLIITPRGIFVSILNHEGNTVAPFYWTPEGVNTAQVWFHPRSVFALDLMMSCIWRDACVVQEQWSEHGKQRGYDSKPSPGGTRNGTITLPRRVYRSSWGHAGDREVLEKIARSAHAVRACYPALPEGHIAHNAEERAAEVFWPAPPEGHTFRKPHFRGEGEPELVRAVRCRGLQVAHILLG